MPLPTGRRIARSGTARGVPDIGEISLALQQEGNEIILSFSDDGAGLDFERIRARAIEVSLLSPEDQPDMAHLADLIFTQGFSTCGGKPRSLPVAALAWMWLRQKLPALAVVLKPLRRPWCAPSLSYIPLTLAAGNKGAGGPPAASPMRFLR